MADDAARFLAGSPDRLALLERLREHPGSPADLADALPMSHRSVQRNLAEFVERGWTEKRDGRYRLTTPGDLVAREHAAYLEALDRIERFAPLFRHLPAADVPDPRWLADADLAVAEPDNPHAPVNHYVTELRQFETDSVRMLSPVLSRLLHDAHADLAMDGVYTELVMADETIERARELNPTEFAVVVSVDILDLYRSPDPVELGLTLGDDRVLLAAYGDDRHLEACAASSDPDLLAWAAERFQRYRDRATLVEPMVTLPFSLRRP
ncbi:MAG: helix-turn-helix transcriptional regulator [Haloplanus sp.]